MNGYIEDEHASGTVVVCEAYLKLLNERVRYEGRQTVHTPCVIGKCLDVLKQLLYGNKKLSVEAMQHLFTINYVYLPSFIVSYLVPFLDITNIYTPRYNEFCVEAVLKRDSNPPFYGGNDWSIERRDLLKRLAASRRRSRRPLLREAFNRRSS